MTQLKAPFPYFGGKSRVAKDVWERFGVVKNYVEPFAGSAAVLLARPKSSVHNAEKGEDYWGIETINDAEGMVENFWRAVAKDPEGVARAANIPVSEARLHPLHLHLLSRKSELVECLMGDLDYYDVDIAGKWVWGACAWIGQGWCRGDGAWVIQDGRLVKASTGSGVTRQIPHLGGAGQGINRFLASQEAQDQPSDAGFNQILAHLFPLSRRMRRVRATCGDWSRVLGPSVTTGLGTTAVFLDPPYEEGSVDYAVGDRTVSSDVRDWCLENGENPLFRIALCGYDGEHNAIEDAGWTRFEWKAAGGYGSQGNGQGRINSEREVIWFSPHCINPNAIEDTLVGAFFDL